LEQLKKLFGSQSFNVNNLVERNPQELQCFGFQLSDLDLSFKKSQAQLSVYYRDVDTPDKDVCDKFQEELAKSPQRIMKQIQDAADKANQHMGDYNKKNPGAKAEKNTEVHDEL
jgi:hypothetical protein